MWAITLFTDAITVLFTGAIAAATAYTLGSVLKNVVGVQD